MVSVFTKRDKWKVSFVLECSAFVPFRKQFTEVPAVMSAHLLTFNCEARKIPPKSFGSSSCIYGIFTKFCTYFPIQDKMRQK